MTVRFASEGSIVMVDACLLDGDMYDLLLNTPLWACILFSVVGVV
jgi:hypothetical protein